ncbi:MAG TPA: hypothetical protein PL155_06420 [Candidatus Omnitrophota bacterium]|nr:hypothetical protein [Candidatus Omnitrophota bacterium]HPD83887.1 hypothetical protein [Candidatus Omnitrophota bacterium]HRZ02744.1 hypothetical protein [Candidatus Omnitrophota bacterium]
MKKMGLILLVVFLSGCVTVKIPKYLQENFPYKKKFYARYEETLTATQQALKDLGWTVSEVANPTAFERQAETKDTPAQEVLIFTEVRQTPLILSSRYMSLNVYVRAAGDSTDVEIRYISVMPILFKSVKNYKNDPVVDKVFDRISELLKP